MNGTKGNDNGFNVLIDLMGKKGTSFYKLNVEKPHQDAEGLIAKDDVVIIKVNSQWHERGGTNTDLLKSIIQAIIDHPEEFTGEIVVADNGQAQYGPTGKGGSLSYERNNAEDHSQSVQKVVDSFPSPLKVSTYLWDNITLKSVYEYSEGDLDDGYIVNPLENAATRIKVSYPKFKTKFGTYISLKKGIWNQETKTYDSGKLKFINVPILKTHGGYYVTGSVKHYMGVVSDKLTKGSSHRSIGTGGMGTEMVETRIPTLNVLDAIWINALPMRGPSTPYSNALRVNIIMASKDPVALDYWAAKYVLLQVAKARNYPFSYTVDPDSTGPSSFGKWLRLSMDEIKKAGYQTTCDEDQINVNIVSLNQGS